MEKRIKVIYPVEEIFEDIPGDPDNVNMKIPDDIAEQMGLKPGDPIRIDVDEKLQMLTITKITITEDTSSE